jgi:flagellar hook assembly protein FlgD
MISFALPQAGRVKLDIYSESGQLVRRLVDHELKAGRHAFRWNGRNEAGQTVAAGIYLYRIIVQDATGKTVFSEARRMTMVK